MDTLNFVASIVLPIVLLIVSLLLAVEAVSLVGWMVKLWRQRLRGE